MQADDLDAFAAGLVERSDNVQEQRLAKRAGLDPAAEVFEG